MVSYLYTPLGLLAPEYKLTTRPRDGKEKRIIPTWQQADKSICDFAEHALISDGSLANAAMNCSDLSPQSLLLMPSLTRF